MCCYLKIRHIEGESKCRGRDLKLAQDYCSFGCAKHLSDVPSAFGPRQMSVQTWTTKGILMFVYFLSLKCMGLICDWLELHCLPCFLWNQKQVNNIVPFLQVQILRHLFTRKMWYVRFSCSLCLVPFCIRCVVYIPVNTDILYFLTITNHCKREDDSKALVMMQICIEVAHNECITV